MICGPSRVIFNCAPSLGEPARRKPESLLPLPLGGEGRGEGRAGSLLPLPRASGRAFARSTSDYPSSARPAASTPSSESLLPLPLGGEGRGEGRAGSLLPLPRASGRAFARSTSDYPSSARLAASTPSSESLLPLPLGGEGRGEGCAGSLLPLPRASGRAFARSTSDYPSSARLAASTPSSESLLPLPLGGEGRGEGRAGSLLPLPRASGRAFARSTSDYPSSARPAASTPSSESLLPLPLGGEGRGEGRAGSLLPLPRASGRAFARSTSDYP